MPPASLRLLSRALTAILAVALVTGGAAVPAVAADATTGGVSGVVLTVDGQPVQTGRVMVNPVIETMQSRSMLIDNGSFAFTGLAPGSYRVWISLGDPEDGGGRWWPGAPDRSRAQTLLVEAGTTTDASWQLTAVYAHVTGVVTDSVTGLPLAGRSVVLKDHDDTQVGRVGTDTNGAYRFDYVVSGQYRLETDEGTNDRYAAHRGDSGWQVTVPETGSVTTDLVLTPRGRITGFLSEVTGHSRMEITRVGPGAFTPPQYFAAGAFASPYLDAGQYVIHLDPSDTGAVAEWWKDAPTRQEATVVTVEPGRDSEIDWRVRQGGAVSGRVTDAETGEPVPGQQVNLSVVGNELGWTTTDADGRYVLKSLPAGDYPLVVTGGGYTRSIAPFRVALGESVTVDVAMHRTGQLDALPSWTGTQMGEVFVEIYDGQLAFVGRAGRNADGHYREYSLDAGVYFVRFLKGTGYLPTWYGGTMTGADSTRVVVRPGQTTTIAQELVLASEANAGALRTVVRGPDGELIDEATVEVYDAEGLRRATLTTREGAASSGHLPAGEYRIHVMEKDTLTWTGGRIPWRHPYDDAWLGGSGLATATPVSVLVGATSTADVHLTRTLPAEAATVTGRIHLGGAPVAGARVSLVSIPTSQVGSTLAAATGYTDTQGRYQIRGVPTGVYKVGIRDGSRWQFPLRYEYVGGATDLASAASHTIGAGQTVTIDHGFSGRLATTTATLLRGQLVAADNGSPVTGATVNVLHEQGWTASLVSDASGYYETDALPAGKVTMWVSPPAGYATPDARARTIVSGSVVAVDVTLIRSLVTVAPKLPSVVRVGKKATVTTSGWTVGATFTYQWRRNGKAIAGATRPTYTPTTGDRGKKLSVVVTGAKAGYAKTSRTSDSRSVSAGVLAAVIPGVRGTAKAGRTLTAVRGDWGSGVTYAYQWYRNGKRIPGATKKTHLLTSRDAGAKITVNVAGRKPGFATTTRMSSPTGRVSR